MKDCPLVFVEWDDSRQPVASWLHLHKMPDPSIVKCVSVGWLLKDGDVLMVAPNMGDIQEDGNVQASGIIQIPKRAVTRMRKLKEPRL